MRLTAAFHPALHKPAQGRHRGAIIAMDTTAFRATICSKHDFGDDDPMPAQIAAVS